mgnify:CR=1 FL=1
MSKAADKAKTGAVKVLARNKKARHEYFIDETLEAGMVLMGSEVKSLRASRCELGDAYASVENGEAFLLDMQISEYAFANRFGHTPKRPRKLLLHKKEIAHLSESVKRDGMTVVPLEVYLKDGKIKVLLGIAKGKKHFDKREDERSREAKAELARHKK